MANYDYIPHARLQMAERGITSQEVELTIESGSLLETIVNRHIRQSVFREGYRWKRREYRHKEVTVVYAVESERTVIVTAIARYGLFGEAR